MSVPRLFCFGFGYTAGFLAQELMAEGWSVAGTTRDGARDSVPADIAIYPFTGGLPLADAPSALAGTTHLLLSIPPDVTGDPVAAEHGDDIAGLPGLRWVGYLSATSVYGDRAGGWVDEDSPLDPSGARGRRRVMAEAAWRDLQGRTGLPLHIFRLAGIYGPGRSALDAVRHGRAQRIDNPGHVFSRIHVADIVAALRASMARPDPGAIYNLADDEPAPPAAVIAHACALLRLPAPPLVPLAGAALSPTARSFYDDNKRVANRRLKEALGIRLRYPSYRDGLAALLAE
ncbi:MAG TPA: SDR family oxidoreductase [Stellaceae bacterium]|nr:SDR family oxidoreductase [Stellaceae bacterium]